MSDYCENTLVFKMEALRRGEGGWVLFKLQWSLIISYVDHGHVVKQFSKNNEMSFVAHFKRSCGTSTIDWLSVVWVGTTGREGLPHCFAWSLAYAIYKEYINECLQSEMI